MWFLRLLSIRSVCTRVTFEDPTSTSKKVWKEHLPKKSWAPTLGSQFLWWYFFKSWSRYFNDLFRFFQKYHNLVKKTSRKTMQKLVGSRKWGNESWYPSRGFMFFCFSFPIPSTKHSHFRCLIFLSLGFSGNIRTVYHRLKRLEQRWHVTPFFAFLNRAFSRKHGREKKNKKDLSGINPFPQKFVMWVGLATIFSENCIYVAGTNEQIYDKDIFIFSEWIG